MIHSWRENKTRHFQVDIDRMVSFD